MRLPKRHVISKLFVYIFQLFVDTSIVCLHSQLFVNNFQLFDYNIQLFVDNFQLFIYIFSCLLTMIVILDFFGQKIEFCISVQNVDKLPSASVLLISTVLPEYKVWMSSGRVARSPTAFSAKQKIACKF